MLQPRIVEPRVQLQTGALEYSFGPSRILITVDMCALCNCQLFRKQNMCLHQLLMKIYDAGRKRRVISTFPFSLHQG